MEIPSLDINHRIGDTFAFLFSFPQTDGTMRVFSASTAVFHAQSGATTFHYESGTDPEITITDSPDGTANAGILVKIPYAETETWNDGQKFFYELREYISGDRYTLINGHIFAAQGVVDGSD